MKYSITWIENNLGITRSAIRVYEAEGFITRESNSWNIEYSEEQVQLIWMIKILKGIGFSLKEIAKIKDGDDFFDLLDKKIRKTEFDLKEKEKDLGYAKMIQLTGKFPSFPKNMGEIKAEHFIEKAKEEWNVYNDPEAEMIMDLTDIYLSGNKDLTGIDEERILQFGEYITETFSNLSLNEMIATITLPYAISNRIELGTNHPEVQLLIKMLFDELKVIYPETKDISRKDFARHFAPSYMEGKIAFIQSDKYGEDGCRFIADAIAIFGGYNDYDDIYNNKQSTN